MMRHSVKPRDLIFVKDYGNFSFAKKSSKILAKKLVKLK